MSASRSLALSGSDSQNGAWLADRVPPELAVEPRICDADRGPCTQVRFAAGVHGDGVTTQVGLFLELAGALLGRWETIHRSAVAPTTREHEHSVRHTPGRATTSQRTGTFPCRRRSPTPSARPAGTVGRGGLGARQNSGQRAGEGDRVPRRGGRRCGQPRGSCVRRRRNGRLLRVRCEHGIAAAQGAAHLRGQGRDRPGESWPRYTCSAPVLTAEQ